MADAEHIPVILMICDNAWAQGAGFDYHCISFASFELTKVDFQGNPSTSGAGSSSGPSSRASSRQGMNQARMGCTR